MLNILVSWLLSALTILAVSKYVPGFKVDTFTTSLVVALVLGILNALIRPVIIILTLPINILTLGLFTLVINAFLIVMTSYLVKGFQVEGFVPAILAALLLWLINTVIHFVAFPVKS